MQIADGDLEQQDSRGWTPVMWSSSNGYCKLVKQMIQRGADVHHMGQARSGSGITMALHECAAMCGEKNQPPEAYYETAWLLMAVGASPFTERSDGLTPIEVAAAHGNVQMKTFLEGCCLFRGTLTMPVPQAFGSKMKSRYCTVQPRFPFGNAAPTLWLVCYKSAIDLQPACKIPLGNARVMIEGAHDSSNGIIIIPSSAKTPKGVHVKSHTSNSAIIEVRANALAKMPGWKILRTLADVCKAAGVAVSCRSLDQLCSAALAQAVQQLKIPGGESLTGLNEGLDLAKGADNLASTSDPLRTMNLKEGKPGQIADSAQDMLPSRSNTSTQQIIPEVEPSTPRLSSVSQAPRRSGIGNIFKSAFRLSSSQPPRKYSQHLLDSSSSLGQLNQPRESKKSGFFGFKRKGAEKDGLDAMPSITEQSAGGLTDADISAFSQPIPDKFWSKMGRKMSSQRPGRQPSQSLRTNTQSWFHEDEGSPSPATLPPVHPKKAFEYNDLNELMYPSTAPTEAPPMPALLPNDARRQTAESIQRPASTHASAGFNLEEPIVPTQRLVNAGPRRSFSFDDLDDMMSGGNRRARGHREEFSAQMMPSTSQQASPNGSTASPAGHRQPNEPAPSVNLKKSNSLPRRSFSYDNVNQLVQPRAKTGYQPQLRHSPEDLQGMQRQGSANRRKGPAIDPNSYGGYQGVPAPEWRPFKPASARTIVVPQQQMQPQGSQRHEQQQPNRQVPNQMGRQGSARVAPPHRPPNQAKAQPLQMPPSQGHPLQMQPTSQQRSQAGQSTQAPAAQAKQPSIGQFIHGPLPQTLQQGRPLPTTIVPHQSKVQRRSGGSSLGKDSQEGIPPELAHLASLRPLETSHLIMPGPSKSVTSQEKSPKSRQPVGKESPAGFNPQIQGIENNAMAAKKDVAYEASQVNVPDQASTRDAGIGTNRDAGPDCMQSLPQPSKQIGRGHSTGSESLPPLTTPAVPSVLFSGPKAPKHAMPPTRIAKEQDIVPEIRHSGSHEFTNRSQMNA